MLSADHPMIHKRLERAVMEVFSNCDFHKANMRTVAKKAEVSFSTIYHYYQSKEGLLLAFVDSWMGELTERMIDHLQGIESLKEKVRKVFWIQLDYYERNPEIGKIIFMTLPMKIWMDDNAFKQNKMFVLFLEVLRQGQKEGTLNLRARTGVLLDFIFGLVQRSFIMWVFRGQTESLSGQANDLFEMVWRAISNPDGEIS
jgi:TetR/AcrR family transcriptional regulator, fatty acid metabolism regulator protein